ncbi:MAG: hypothetical protein ACOC0G_00795 [Thermodesulfobacteriota bacterium]
MPISGNPKKMARDIAEGFVTLSPPMLRHYNQNDMRVILNHLEMEIRTLRQEKIPLEDVMAIKARNHKISRVNQTMVMLRGYCKRRGIRI